MSDKHRDPIEEMKAVLGRANDLYAAYLVKKGALTKLDESVAGELASAKKNHDEAVTAAKAVYDRKVADQQGRTDKASAEMLEAENDLREYQESVRAEHGVEINLFPASGGSTRL